MNHIPGIHDNEPRDQALWRLYFNSNIGNYMEMWGLVSELTGKSQNFSWINRYAIDVTINNTNTFVLDVYVKLCLNNYTVLVSDHNIHQLGDYYLDTPAHGQPADGYNVADNTTLMLCFAA